MRRTQLAGLLCLFLWCARAIVPDDHAAISAHAQSYTTIAHARTATSPSCLNDPTIGSKVWTVAISDTLAFRLTGVKLNSDGYIRNSVVDGKEVCGYRDGNPREARIAPDGFNCRVDVPNALWGFCDSGAQLRDCFGLIVKCFDKGDCSKGCGANNPKFKTVTW
jgi:hypothetical protein